MKFYINFLFISILFSNEKIDSHGEITKKEFSKQNIQKEALVTKSFIKKLVENEDKEIGLKNKYFFYSCKYYLRYIQAIINEQKKDATTEWILFQQNRISLKESTTPYTFYTIKAGFGYWLYNRIAYPKNKTNFGFVKKNAAILIIPVLLFKDFLFFDSKLKERQQVALSEQFEKINKLEQELTNRKNTLENTEKTQNEKLKKLNENHEEELKKLNDEIRKRDIEIKTRNELMQQFHETFLKK